MLPQQGSDIATSVLIYMLAAYFRWRRQGALSLLGPPLHHHLCARADSNSIHFVLAFLGFHNTLFWCPANDTTIITVRPRSSRFVYNSSRCAASSLLFFIFFVAHSHCCLYCRLGAAACDSETWRTNLLFTTQRTITR
jgi:hypothetical protein